MSRLPGSAHSGPGAPRPTRWLTGSGDVCRRVPVAPRRLEAFRWDLMVQRGRERAGWAELLLADRPPGTSMLRWLCTRSVSLAAVTGAAVSMSTTSGVLATVTASDDEAAQLESLQSTLGEGPCLDALAGGRPVLVADLARAGCSGSFSWPLFSAAALEADVRAVFAFPLQVGAVRLGALDLYRSLPGQLADEQLAAALVAADLASWALLHTGGGPGEPADPAAELDEAAGFRLEVHQAAGMVMVQLGSSIGTALARLRAHAFASGRALDTVAADVLSGRLRFQPEEGSEHE